MKQTRTKVPAGVTTVTNAVAGEVKPASSGISGLFPCPVCGGRSFSFTYSEDFGYLLCDPCFAGIGIDLDDLPRYSEIGELLEDCPAETKRPLIDKWNTRAW